MFLQKPLRMCLGIITGRLVIFTRLVTIPLSIRLIANAILQTLDIEMSTSNLTNKESSN